METDSDKQTEIFVIYTYYNKIADSKQGNNEGLLCVNEIGFEQTMSDAADEVLD